jgi:CRISPR-associated endoribonuclease Cas6
VLVALMVQFQADRRTDIGDLSGFRVAAAVLELLHRYDPELSAALHDDRLWPRRMKPYTVSAAAWSKPPLPKAPVGGRRAQFRLTLLDGGLFGPVISALSQMGHLFRLGPGLRAAPIVGLDFDYARNPWAGLTLPAELWQNAPETPTVRIVIASPASFRSTQRSDHVPRPTGPLIVGSLLPKWNAWTGRPVDAGLRDRLRSGLQVFPEQVRREVARIDDINFVGFTGTLRLEAPDGDTGKLLNALLGLAFYTGLGIKTADGMGQTMLLQA